MLMSRGYPSLCYIILTNGPWKRQDIHPSACFCTLAFPTVKSKEWSWVSFVKCLKDAEKWRMPHFWSVSTDALVHRSLLWYMGNKEKFDFRSLPFQHVLAVTVLAGPSQSLSHWQSKEMEGLNQLCDLLLTETWSLMYFWLNADIQGCGELPMYTSIANWFRAYAFLFYFSPNRFITGTCTYKDNSSNNSNEL